MDTRLKEMMLWFIGAEKTVTMKENGKVYDAKLPKTKEGEATRKEVIKFLRRIGYSLPYKKPSTRAIYQWLKDLEDSGFVEVKYIKGTRGRPRDVLKLTEKGAKRRILINEKFKSDFTLTSPSDIHFTVGPKREWMMVHAMTYDTDLIKLVWSELDEVTKERERPLRGSLPRDVIFRNHPVFKNIGAAIFAFIIAYLKMRNATIPYEIEEKLLELSNGIPLNIRQIINIFSKAD